jgi:hypothetical protein
LGARTRLDFGFDKSNKASLLNVNVSKRHHRLFNHYMIFGPTYGENGHGIERLLMEHLGFGDNTRYIG